jgi:hypothetical protein
MKEHFACTIIVVSLFLFPIHYTSYAADLTIPPNTPIRVYFSPEGECSDAIINEIDQAKMEILVQAYSFTSAPIAKALVDAHK